MEGIKFELVPEEGRVDGENYLCEMKHGYIEGVWDSSEGTCTGYYWGDIRFYPICTYRQC